MLSESTHPEWLRLLKEKFEGYFVNPNDPIISKWLATAQHGIDVKGAEHVEAIRKLMGQPLDNINALDAGCGSGDISFALAKAGAIVVGIDVDPGFIQICESRQRSQAQPNVRFALDNLAKHPDSTSQASFDIAASIDVIEHVKSPEQYLSHLYSVLKPGGHLYLLTGNKFALSNIWRDPHYKLAGVVLMPKSIGRWYVCSFRKKVKHFDVEKMFSVGSLHELARRQGFRVRSVTQDHAVEALKRRPALYRLVKMLHLEHAAKIIYERFWAHTIRFWAEKDVR